MKLKLPILSTLFAAHERKRMMRERRKGKRGEEIGIKMNREKDMYAVYFSQRKLIVEEALDVFGARELQGERREITSVIAAETHGIIKSIKLYVKFVYRAPHIKFTHKVTFQNKFFYLRKELI